VMEDSLWMISKARHFLTAVVGAWIETELLHASGAIANGRWNK